MRTLTSLNPSVPLAAYPIRTPFFGKKPPNIIDLLTAFPEGAPDGKVLRLTSGLEITDPTTVNAAIQLADQLHQQKKSNQDVVMAIDKAYGKDG